MSQHEIRVGHLVTVTQDEYPALGALFVQLWHGESVVARVYGNTHDELNQRISMLLPEQEKQDQSNTEDQSAEEIKTPAGMRAEGRPYCPQCYTFGHVHRKDCLHRNDGIAKHVAIQQEKGE